MIQLPIREIEQLLLELNEYTEIFLYDNHYELCINKDLDNDLIGIVTFHTSVYSAFLLLIDFRLFHVYGKYRIGESEDGFGIYLENNINIWFEDVGHFSYYDCSNKYNEVTESLLYFSKDLKSKTPNDFSSYDYEDLMTGLIDRLVLYSNLPVVYPYLEVIHEGVMLEALRTTLRTNINRLIELRH